VIPGLSTAKLIGFGLGALAVLAFIGLSLRWRHEMTARGEQLAAICTATRAAANQRKLDCKQVPQQITFMGEAVQALSNSLKVQNAAVSALGEQTKAQQAEAAKARQKAAESAQEAEAASQRLDASSRQKPPQGQPCEPSKAVKEQWQ
jgi:hypothetical protein